jgi:tetratricopeptide (TPR) repeat protein
MGSEKRPLGHFELAASEDEVVYGEGDSTSIDDSYLASLSERLSLGEGDAPFSRPGSKGNGQGVWGARMPAGTANPLAIGADDAPRPEYAMSPGHRHDAGSDVMELEPDALEDLDDDQPTPAPAGQYPGQQFGASPSYPPPDAGQAQQQYQAFEAPLSSPIRPGPSDLLQSVPPAPEDSEILDPEVNPATYEAPTFIRPSLIEQDPVPIVEIVQGNEKGRAYRFEKDMLSFGRGLDNDVVVTDIAVSRRHLKMSRQGNAVTLEDLGSGNGTLVNGAKVRVQQLQGTDRVEVGNTIFRIVFPGEESFPPQPVPAQPVVQPSGPLHQKSTMYLSDGQNVLAQVEAAARSVSVEAAPGPYVSEPTPSAQVPVRQYESPRRTQQSPWSFKLAMAGLVVLVLIVGMVGLLAALYLRHNLAQPAQPVAAAQEPSAESEYGRGMAAFAEKRWLTAAESFERTLALSPDHAAAREHLAQARAEQQNDGTLEAARQALADQNYEGAITSLETIPQSSVYYTDAMDLRARARQAQSDALVASAARNIASGNRVQARQELDQALSLNPSNARAQELLHQIEEPIAEHVVQPPPPSAPIAVAPSPPSKTAPPSKNTVKRIDPPPRKAPSVPSAPPASAKKEQGRPSSGLNDILTQYKAGRFEAAVARANELAASAPSDDERQRARGMTSKIERFASVWSSAKSTSNARQKLSYLENALKLDQQISGGYYASKLRPELLEVYESDAKRSWRAGQYTTACQYAMRVAKLDPASSFVEGMSKRCESQAQEYYEDGEAARSSDIDQAKALWRKVLNMVPRSSPWYSKAYNALNNTGRRGREDEDE